MRDAVATMGTILDKSAKGRDAVHVACVAVTAAESCWIGSDVGILLTEDGYIASPKLTPHIGIVDPFLKTTANKGEKFWLYLYPRSITGLNHNWTHPAFPEGDVLPQLTEKQKSERWLREFVAGADCPAYDDLLAILTRVANGETDGSFGEDGDNFFRFDDEYLHFNGTDAHGDIPPEFWDHASAVIGKPIKGERPAYFSCSC